MSVEVHIGLMSFNRRNMAEYYTRSDLFKGGDLICPAVHINTDTTALKCVINSHTRNRHKAIGVVFAKAISTIARCLILMTKK